MSSAMSSFEVQVCSDVAMDFRCLFINPSVPLYWNQSGHGLKPPPQLSTERTHAQHAGALRRHFDKIVPQYGPQVKLHLSVHDFPLKLHRKVDNKSR